MGDTRHEIPFTISPGNGARLAVQAADGFRKAILSGYYRPGDVLPTFRELAKMLGTSIRIPIEAFKILSAEGLVVSRQGSGSVVLSPGERVWKGCVAFVSVGADASPFTNLLAAAMREQISNAGYLFVRAAVPVLPDGSYDYAALDMLLGKTVSLAILIYDYPEVARFKSRDITLPTKVRLVKVIVFSVIMYGFESWTVKKAERRGIDGFELWCWRRLLRVPWTARSNQSILKKSILNIHWND